MNNSEKSIAYAFIANGVQIYLNDTEDHFMISKLVCTDCGDSWYMNLTECFLCGAINPFLYRCSSCNTFQSITKSSHKCNNCESEDLFMVCSNPECISNTNKNLFDSIKRYGGIFNRESGLLISQQYCLTCGSKNHYYKNYKIYVRDVEKDKIDFNELQIDKKNLSDNAYLIIKQKQKDSSIKYGLYKIREIINKKIELKNLKNNFSSLVLDLYPIVSK